MFKWRKRAVFFIICIGIAIAVAVAGWALGDIYIIEGGLLHYVPQAGQSQAQAQRYTLAVRGMARGEVNGPPVAVEYLPGAVFGIYAPDAQGNMQPWPDPRAPHAPFLIRTESEPVSFDLPDGMAFFMRQESAPEGYLPIPEGYWPIEGILELRADNAMPGGLEVTAEDADGQPLAGARVRLLQDGQLVREGVTGADGAWRADPLPAGGYVIENAEPPLDFLPAPDPSREITVRDATWAGGAFVHQRKGRVLIQAEHVAMRGDGQLERTPLAGMALQLLDGDRRPVPVESVDGWRTDANGLAQSPLPAGDYVLRVAQLASETEFSIADGQDTELAPISQAQEGYIRFAFTGGLPDQGAVPLVGVRCELWQGKTLIGEYTTDPSGHAITAALAPGAYTLRYEELPQGYALPDGLREGEPLTLEAATLAERAVLCPPVLTGRFTVCIGEVDETGDLIETPVGEADFSILHADGAVLQVRSGPGGEIEITLPAGDYLLRPPTGRQALAHVLEEPVAFSLPQERETVLLRTKLTRVTLRSVGQDGARLSGAAYRVTGPNNKVFELVADAQGQSVSPALEPGMYRVETSLSPEGFGPAEALQIECLAGVPAVADALHRPLGRLEIKLETQALTSQGEVREMPRSGASVALFRLAEGGEEDDPAAYHAYPSQQTALTLVTDVHGVARDAAGALPALPAGVYRAFAADAQGYEAAGLSLPVRVQDGEQPLLRWVTRAAQGGVRITLRDAEDTQRPLTDAAFALALLEVEGDHDGPLIVDEQGLALRVQLPQGRYRLWQTRCPDGYHPAPDQEIEITGGELTEVSLVNARPGTLSVSKMGFTFNAQMQQFRVPLRGAYGLYALNGERYEPYPSADAQWVIAAHSMQIEGAMEAAELPADMGGAVYYLRELESAVSPGYVADAGYHQALVYPGQHTVAETVAVADKGFFALTHRSAHDGAVLTGARYALYALVSDEDDEPVWEEEPTLAFSFTGESYQNEMALPVGSYLLRMLRAPAGYMLDGSIEAIEQLVEIPPYAHRGNPMAQVEMRSMPAPAADGSSPANALLVSRDWVRTLRVDPSDLRADIVAVENVPATAQVTYCLALGGWNWDDARFGAQVLDLTDVDGRITAVQIRYSDAPEGDGPRPTVSREPGADCALIGDYAYSQQYRDERGEQQTIRVVQPIADPGEPEWAEGRGARKDQADVETGAVTGTVRYRGDIAAVPVLLARQDEAGVATIIAEAVTDAQGAFRFDGLPYGTYRLRFVPGEDQLVAGITAGNGLPAGERAEGGEGLTDAFVLDANQRWHWAEAELDRAAVARGSFVLDGDQAGVPGVEVSLWREEKRLAAALTDAQGYYVLSGVPEGAYRLRVALPEGTVFADAEQAAEQRLTLALGETQLPPVAVTLPASLAGYVLAEGGSRGVPAARVELLREGSDAVVNTARTDARGFFAFDGLTPAAYSLRISLPSDYAFPRGAGEPERFVLAMGEVRNDVMIEAVRPAKLTVSVWEDGDYSGIPGGKSGGVAGVRVALAPEGISEPQAQTLDWRTTGPDGVALFERMEPGVYELWHDLPAPWRLTRRLDEQGRELPMQPGATGRGQRIVLGDGQETETGIGLVLPASLRGAVWQDADDNGLWDAGEAPFESIEVRLLDPSGAVKARETITGEDGAFSFEEVPPGAYRLEFAAPEGWVFAAGADGSKLIKLGLGQALEGESIGVVRTGQVCGLVWEDANDNGEIDPGESGLTAANIALYRLTGSRGQRELVAEQFPGADGSFVFDGLRPGAYRLECTLPEGYVMGRAAQSTLGFEAGRSRQSPLRSAAFTLAMGEKREGIALAALRLGSITGSIWEDKNYDGLRGDGEAGLFRATVALLRDGQPGPVAVTETVRTGAYRFDALPPGDYTVRITLPEGYLFTRTSGQSLPEEGAREAGLSVSLAMGQAIGGLDAGGLMPASLGGLVWADTNNDGMLDANEPPVPEVMVELLRADDPEHIVATAVTDEGGRWRIGEVMPGAYLIRATLPEGYLFAAAPKWRSAVRAGRIYGVDGPTALSETLQVEAGQRIDQFNFGGIPAALVGGQVWLDADDDGRRSPGDPALSGVRVTLLSAGEAVAVAETDETGAYRLTGLRPGAYTLRFVLPDGHLFAREGESLIHSLDVPAGESAPFSLAMGHRLTGQDVGALEGAMMRGAVWLDADENGIWGSDEKGLAGVLAELLDAANDEVLASMRTLDDGVYRFDQLRPGAYQVRIDLPEGDLFAPQAADVLALRDARLGQTETLRLAMGEEAHMGHAAAIHGATVSGIAWEDADVNGRFDEGEGALTGAGAVLLRQEDGDWKTVGAQPVDQGGRYAFDSLHPGAYAVRFTLPPGYLFADYLPGEQGPRSMVPLVDGQVGQTEPFELAMGQIRADLHVGGIRPGMVGDYAWIDENGNGLQDYGEPPLVGVQVTLFAVRADGSAAEVASVITDQYGLYRFNGLRPGVYRVEATLPQGYAFTVNRPDLREIASAIPEGPGPSGASEDFVLRSGQARRNMDIGAKRVGQ